MRNWLLFLLLQVTLRFVNSKPELKMSKVNYTLEDGIAIIEVNNAPVNALR